MNESEILKMKCYKNINKIVLAIMLMTLLQSCGPGSPAAVVKVNMQAEFIAEQGTTDNTGKYVLPDGDLLELQGFTLHIAAITATNTAGNSGQIVEFDEENPPKPYENCHAGHCHIHGTDQTISIGEIKEKLGGGTVGGKTAVMSIETDKSIIMNSFNRLISVDDIPLGELPYGQVTEIAVTVDRVDLLLKLQSDGRVYQFTNSHLHGDEIHAEAVDASCPLQLSVTRESEESQEVNLQIQVLAEMLGELPFDEDGGSDIEHEHSADEHDHEHEEDFDFADLFGEHFLLKILEK